MHWRANRSPESPPLQELHVRCSVLRGVQQHFIIACAVEHLPKLDQAPRTNTHNCYLSYLNCAGLKSKEAVAKPPNSKNASKAVKRAGQAQPTSGTAKAAKTAKAASTSKASTSKPPKAAAKPKTAAELFSAVQPGAAGAGTSAANPNVAAGKDAAKPADQAPKRDRKKACDINIEEAVAKVKAANTAGMLAKLSLLELKAYLKSVGKPVGGKKAELVERVETITEP